MTTSFTKTLIIFSCLCALGACNSEKDNSITTTPSNNPAAKIDESDFMVSASELGADEFTEALTYAHYYDNLFQIYEGDTDLTCIYNLMDVYPFKPAGDDYYLRDTPLINQSSCDDSNFMDSQLTYESSSEGNSYSLIKIIDQFGAPINLEGKLSSEVDSYFKAPYKVSMLQKASGTFGSITTTNETGTVHRTSSDFKKMMSSKNGINSACTIDFNIGLIDDCAMHHLEITTTSSSDDPEGYAPEERVSVNIVEFHNLQGSETGEYYTSGSIDFTLNNWDGVFTFGEYDENTPPNYTATNGVENITGQIKSLDVLLNSPNQKPPAVFKSMSRL